MDTKTRKLTWLVIVTWVDAEGRTRHATSTGSLKSSLEYGEYYRSIGRQVDYSLHASYAAAFDRAWSVIGPCCQGAHSKDRRVLP